MAVGSPLAGLYCDRADKFTPVIVMFSVVSTVLITILVVFGPVLHYMVLVVMFISAGVALSVMPLLFTLTKKWNDDNIAGLANGCVNTILVVVGTAGLPVA